MRDLRQLRSILLLLFLWVMMSTTHLKDLLSFQNHILRQIFIPGLMLMNKPLKNVFPLQIIVSNYAANQHKSAYKQDHFILQCILCDHEVDRNSLSGCLANSKPSFYHTLYYFCSNWLENDEK